MTRQFNRIPWAMLLAGWAVVGALTACQNTVSNPVETTPIEASDSTANADDTITDNMSGNSINADNTGTEDLEIASSTTKTEADAIVSAVAAPPVWVKSIATNEDQPAITGTALIYGDTIRTEGEGLAHVDLASGLSFRIGGDASLVLQPDKRLNLQAGEMVTWVEPGRQVPTEIVTPVGIAGLRGTTLFVLVPPDENGEVLFLSWEGTIRLQIADGVEEILLESGEELRVRPGDRDVAALRQRIRRLDRQEIRRRRRQSPLLNRFQRPLPTSDLIQETLESAP